MKLLNMMIIASLLFSYAQSHSIKEKIRLSSRIFACLKGMENTHSGTSLDVAELDNYTEEILSDSKILKDELSNILIYRQVNFTENGGSSPSPIVIPAKSINMSEINTIEKSVMCGGDYLIIVSGINLEKKTKLSVFKVTSCGKIEIL